MPNFDAKTRFFEKDEGVGELGNASSRSPQVRTRKGRKSRGGRIYIYFWWGGEDGFKPSSPPSTQPD